MGVELELYVLLALLTLGSSIFLLIGVTVGLHAVVGHLAVLFPLAAVGAGAMVHYSWCRKHAIHPIHATPRRKYYELRGWSWPA